MAELSENTHLLMGGDRNASPSLLIRWLAVVKDEFNRKNFFFGFDRKEVFHSSQWACCSKFLFLCYRFLLMSYSVTITVVSIAVFAQRSKHPWPVWLTHWSYFMLTAHLICSAVISFLHLRHSNPTVGTTNVQRNVLVATDDDATPASQRQNIPWNVLTASDDATPAPQRQNIPWNVLTTSDDATPAPQTQNIPWYMRLNWLLFAVASAASVIVTCIYFAALFPQKGTGSLSDEDINLHLMNTVVVILEFAFSALPVRLFHFLHVLIYGAVYTAFSAIYWSLDPQHNVLYPGVIDWNHPGKTGIFLAIFAVVGIPLLQMILFCAYRLRLFIFKHVNAP